MIVIERVNVLPWNLSINAFWMRLDLETGYQTQGEGNEHDLDSMCFLTVCLEQGVHIEEERVIYVRKELGESLYFKFEMAL